MSIAGFDPGSLIDAPRFLLFRLSTDSEQAYQNLLTLVIGQIYLIVRILYVCLTSCFESYDIKNPVYFYPKGTREGKSASEGGDWYTPVGETLREILSCCHCCGNPGQSNQLQQLPMQAVVARRGDMIDVACQVNIINNSLSEVEDRLIYVYKGDLKIHRFLRSTVG